MFNVKALKIIYLIKNAITIETTGQRLPDLQFGEPVSAGSRSTLLPDNGDNVRVCINAEFGLDASGRFT